MFLTISCQNYQSLKSTSLYLQTLLWDNLKMMRTHFTCRVYEFIDIYSNSKENFLLLSLLRCNIFSRFWRHRGDHVWSITLYKYRKRLFQISVMFLHQSWEYPHKSPWLPWVKERCVKRKVSMGIEANSVGNPNSHQSCHWVGSMSQRIDHGCWFVVNLRKAISHWLDNIKYVSVGGGQRGPRLHNDNQCNLCSLSFPNALERQELLLISSIPSFLGFEHLMPENHCYVIPKILTCKNILSNNDSP